MDDEKKAKDGVSLEEGSPSKLTAAQKARIEKNKEQALLLRQARLKAVKRDCPDGIDKATLIPAKLYVKKRDDSVGLLACQKDTGAGFFIEEDDDEELAKAFTSPVIAKELPPPVLGVGGLAEKCTDCEKDFSDSILLRDFEVSVCDGCRDNEKHKLCTRTEAKQFYLLKDCDLDLRSPKLNFVVRKNPHNDRWGQMRLYYKQHIIARAVEVWGSLDNVEDEKERRLDNKEKTKQKKYENRIKELRRAVRTSTWKKKLEQNHVHEYSEEVYDEDNDEYSKECISCGYVLTYEKM
eukprot:gene19529-21459_t